MNHQCAPIMNRYYITVHSEVLGHKNNCSDVVSAVSIMMLKSDSAKISNALCILFACESFLFLHSLRVRFLFITAKYWALIERIETCTNEAKYLCKNVFISVTYRVLSAESVKMFCGMLCRIFW
jgi:hypothetical protein